MPDKISENLLKNQMKKISNNYKIQKLSLKYFMPLVLILILLLFIYPTISKINKRNDLNGLVNGRISQEIGTSASVCDNIRKIKYSPDWVLIGPSNGRVNTIERATHGILYIGTNSGGVFQSLNKGRTWKHYSKGLDSSNINYLKFINGKLYAATGDGIYVLKGSIWQNLFKPNPSEIFLKLDYSSATNTMFALSQYGLYSSKDNLNWMPIKTFDSSRPHTALRVSKRGTVYASTIEKLFQSTDNGQSWEQIFSGVISLVEDTQGNVYAPELSQRKLYKKLWNENIFQELIAAPRVGVGNLEYSNGSLYVDTFDSLYVSTNGGQTFSKIIQSLNGGSLQGTFWDIRQIYPIEENKIILANDNGVSEINTLTKLIKRYEISGYSEIVSLAASIKSDILLTSYFDHAGVISNDCGADWSQVQGWEDSYYFLEPKIDDMFIIRDYATFLLFLSSSPSTTFRSLPYGYFPVANPRNSIAFDTSKNPTRAYVLNESFNPQNGERQGILISFNMIADVSQFNFTEIKLPFAYVQSIAIDPSNGARILITANGNIYESLDKGATWSKLAELRLYRTLYEIAINPFNPGETIIGGFEGDVLQVKNGAVLTLKLPYTILGTSNNKVYAVAYDDKNPNVIYAGSQQGFFYSIDDGATWKQFNNGLYSKDVRKIIPQNDKIFIGTWGSGNAVISKGKILKR